MLTTSEATLGGVADAERTKTVVGLPAVTPLRSHSFDAAPVEEHSSFSVLPAVMRTCDGWLDQIVNVIATGVE
jgi:hypothetical protein